MGLKEREGHVHCKIIIEMLGKPKEHVEEALREYVQQIKQNNEIEVLEEFFGDFQPKEDMWTGFVELEMLMKDLSTLIGFCFDYMPASIEVIEPEELKMLNREISNMINDLQGKLHNLDMLVKNMKAENVLLRKNMRTLLKNIVSVLLLGRSLNLMQLSKATGIGEKEMNVFLEGLVKGGYLAKEGDVYSLKHEREKQD